MLGDDCKLVQIGAPGYLHSDLFTQGRANTLRKRLARRSTVTLERRNAFDVSVVVRIQPNEDELCMLRSRAFAGPGSENLRKLLAGIRLVHVRMLGQVTAWCQWRNRAISICGMFGGLDRQRVAGPPPQDFGEISLRVRLPLLMH